MKDIMKVRNLKENNSDELIEIIGIFRVELASFRGVDKEIDLCSVEEELREYRSKDYPIYVAVKDSKIVGYIVCKVENDVV